MKKKDNKKNAISLTNTWQTSLPALLAIVETKNVDALSLANAKELLAQMATAADYLYGVIPVVGDAESFIRGFEDDDTQEESLEPLLAQLQAISEGVVIPEHGKYQSPVASTIEIEDIQQAASKFNIELTTEESKEVLVKLADEVVISWDWHIIHKAIADFDFERTQQKKG